MGFHWFRPDYGWSIHSHDDDAEEGGPEADPEPDGEVGHPVGEAEVHQDLLEDEDGPSAAQDGEGLPGEQAEHAPGQQVAQEGLQHALWHIINYLVPLSNNKTKYLYAPTVWLWL